MIRTMLKIIALTMMVGLASPQRDSIGDRVYDLERTVSRLERRISSLEGLVSAQESTIQILREDYDQRHR
jgi:predicted RNase H-like nuclease (RuvC/YqgF family)